MKGRCVLEHRIDGPRQLVGQDSHGFPLSVFCLQAGELFLSCRLVAQEQRGGLRKGPLEGGGPDCFPGRAQAFARRFLGTRAQTALGDNSLHRRNAVHVVHVIEQHEAEELTETGDGLPQTQRVSVMVLGRLDDRECDLAQ